MKLLNSLKLFIFTSVLSCSLSSCSTSLLARGEFERIETENFESDSTMKGSKAIFVFFDGTLNDKKNPSSQTNVYKLFKLLKSNADKNTKALYIEGVGTTKTAPLTGSAIGRGMEQRIIKGYEYVANSYSPGDNIFFFGFSRGALQARATAGLIAYAGLPVTNDTIKGFTTYQSNKVVETVKNYRDKTFYPEWRKWSNGSQNPLKKTVAKRLKIPFQSVNVKFVGVWDTVPGATFKKFDHCKQNIGFLKKYLHWAIPAVNRGERYKTDSYPNIEEIVHAVSIDEKRSKFKPLLLCPSLVEGKTAITELWFPGAHADVGGGYSDSEGKGLSLISLNWMIKRLSTKYKFRIIPYVIGDATGLAHWSMGDSPANALSKCEDRQTPNNTIFHNSYHIRASAGLVPVRVKGVTRKLKYPLMCNDTLDNKAKFRP